MADIDPIHFTFWCKSQGISDSNKWRYYEGWKAAVTVCQQDLQAINQHKLADRLTKFIDPNYVLEELLSCPCCLGSASFSESPECAVVFCTSCGLQINDYRNGQIYDRKTLLTAKWNNRRG